MRHCNASVIWPSVSTSQRLGLRNAQKGVFVKFFVKNYVYYPRSGQNAALLCKNSVLIYVFIFFCVLKGRNIAYWPQNCRKIKQKAPAFNKRRKNFMKTAISCGKTLAHFLIKA